MAEVVESCQILFVCTGNTCRSPLAQALCARLLADRLGCEPADLSEHGFIVQSAGLAAMIGAGATLEAVAVAREFGADLTGHKSQPLTPELLARTDFLFAMTQTHLHLLSSLGLSNRPILSLLSDQGEDIADPIGASAEVYRECARQIRKHLEARLTELLNGLARRNQP
jgi:protein-tyrosine phosphatase